MTDREKFEVQFAKEMDDEGCELSEFNNGDYRNEVTQSYWLTWLAALSSQQPADDGWIEWAGDIDPKSEPVLGSSIVEVRFRKGEGREVARRLYWGHAGCDSDIIAYRVVKP